MISNGSVWDGSPHPLIMVGLVITLALFAVGVWLHLKYRRPW